jgi:hypothetical protein
MSHLLMKPLRPFHAATLGGWLFLAPSALFAADYTID